MWSPTNAKQHGTMWGRPPAVIVASRATGAAANRSVTSAANGVGEFTPLRHGQRTGVVGDHLHADVVGAGGLVVVDAHRHRGWITPRHDGIHQAVAAAAGDVVFC